MCYTIHRIDIREAERTTYARYSHGVAGWRVEVTDGKARKVSGLLTVSLSAWPVWARPAVKELKREL